MMGWLADGRALPDQATAVNPRFSGKENVRCANSSSQPVLQDRNRGLAFSSSKPTVGALLPSALAKRNARVQASSLSCLCWGRRGWRGGSCSPQHQPQSRWQDRGVMPGREAQSGTWEEGFWNSHHHEASKPAPTQQQTTAGLRWLGQHNQIAPPPQVIYISLML